MSFPKGGEDVLACDKKKQSPGLATRSVEKIYRREKKSIVLSRKFDASEALRLKNLRVKKHMSEELLRMGFSKEAVGRILNFEPDRAETV